MMGKKKLSEIKAELGLPLGDAPGKAIKTKRVTKRDAKALEATLGKVLAELEREVNKRRTPKARRQTVKP
jgi:hypothetical protein